LHVDYFITSARYRKARRIRINDAKNSTNGFASCSATAVAKIALGDAGLKLSAFKMLRSAGGDPLTATTAG